MDALPDELVLNIFHRLPLKGIGSCICVNKYWLSLIKNQSFISSYSDKNNPYLIFWRPNNNFDLCRDDSMFSFYKSYTLLRAMKSNVLSVESNCNGLILFSVKLKGSRFLLWNPTVKRLAITAKPNLLPPKRNDYEQHTGFWFDSVTNDFKVIRILCFKDQETRTQAEIFSLNTNSWKVVSVTGPRFKIVGPSLPVLNGSVHWIAEYDRTGFSVLCFDVIAEVFKKIDLHEDIKIGVKYLKLATYKDSSIAICCTGEDDKDRDVLLMEEYGNAESWTNIWNYDEDFELSVCDLPLPAYKTEHDVLGLCKNGEILLKVLLYDEDEDEDYFCIVSADSAGENMKVKNVETDYLDDRYKPCYFVESLVLLDKANAISL